MKTELESKKTRAVCSNGIFLIARTSDVACNYTSRRRALEMQLIDERNRNARLLFSGHGRKNLLSYTLYYLAIVHARVLVLSRRADFITLFGYNISLASCRHAILQIAPKYVC